LPAGAPTKQKAVVVDVVKTPPSDIGVQ